MTMRVSKRRTKYHCDVVRGGGGCSYWVVVRNRLLVGGEAVSWYNHLVEERSQLANAKSMGVWQENEKGKGNPLR